MIKLNSIIKQTKTKYSFFRYSGSIVPHVRLIKSRFLKDLAHIEFIRLSKKKYVVNVVSKSLILFTVVNLVP